MSCESVSQKDPLRGAVCRDLVQNRGVDEGDLHEAADVDRVMNETAVAESLRVFEAFRTLCQPGRSRLPASLAVALCPSALGKPFLTSLRGQGIDVPFLFPQGDGDRSFMGRVLAARDRLKTAQDYFRFVRDKKEGLGVRYDPNALNASSQVTDVYASGVGNCLETVFLYVAIAILTGRRFKVYDIFETPGNAHVLFALEKESGGYEYLDPEKGMVAHAPSRDRAMELSPLHLYEAFHYNQAYLGCRRSSSLEACRAAALRAASRYAPRYFRVHYGLTEGETDIRKVVEHLVAALEDNPYFSDAVVRLEAVLQRKDLGGWQTTALWRRAHEVLDRSKRLTLTTSRRSS